MAHLFADGFDWIASSGDLTMRWTSLAAPNNINIIGPAGTAFGVGQAIELRSPSSTTILSKTFSGGETVLYANVRRRQVDGNLNSDYSHLQFADGAGAHCTVRWNADGSLSLRSGGPTGTELLLVAAAHSAGAWDSWQIKAVIHATAGSIEVRKNGSLTPIALVSNVNTKASTSGLGDRASLGKTAGSGVNTLVQFDDVFFNSGSGAAPNTWPGDLRAYSNIPNAAAQAQFTPSKTTSMFGTVNGVSPSFTMTNSTMRLFRLFADQTGQMTAVTLGLTGAPAGSMQAAIYAADGPDGTAGTLRGVSNVLTNPGVGLNTFTLPAIAVTRDAPVWVALISSATFNLAGSGSSGVLTATVTNAYASGFPATCPLYTAAAGITPSLGVTVSSIPQVSLVADPVTDGDASYVFSATSGQKDLYSFPPLPMNPASIVGVVPFCIVRKTDAGTREVAVKAKSGAAEVAAVADGALPQSYTFVGGFLDKDPAVNDRWVTATVNALQVGPAVTA